LSHLDPQEITHLQS